MGPYPPPAVGPYPPPQQYVWVTEERAREAVRQGRRAGAVLLPCGLLLGVACPVVGTSVFPKGTLDTVSWIIGCGGALVVFLVGCALLATGTAFHGGYLNTVQARSTRMMYGMLWGFCLMLAPLAVLVATLGMSAGRSAGSPVLAGLYFVFLLAPPVLTGFAFVTGRQTLAEPPPQFPARPY